MHRVDRVLLAASYVVLIVVVAGLAWFIQHALDQARQERCELAADQSAVTIAALVAIQGQEQADATLARISDELGGLQAPVNNLCGDVFRVDLG